MARVRPFTGLLFDPAAGPLDALTAPPYDMISPADQARLYATSPYNVVRLILGRDQPHDDAATNRHTRAAAFLDSWRRAGVLRPTDTPCVFPYEMAFRWEGRPRRIRGMLAEVELEPWGGSIVPHERTMAGPMRDRLTLIRAVRANLSAVYCVVPSAVPALGAFLSRHMADPADRETVDETGTEHRLWIRPCTSEVEAGLADRQLMIADGHHRYTVALEFREEMRAVHGPGPWDSMMMLIVDAVTEDPPVLPIHRSVARADPGRDAAAGAAAAAVWLPPGIRVRDLAETLAGLDDAGLTVGAVTRERGVLTHAIHSLEGRPPAVCVLHERALDRIDPSRLSFIPDAAAAERSVAAGDADAAYLLPPTRVDRVWDVISHGRRLPQKSTYFWPKPRTGMVIRAFDGS